MFDRHPEWPSPCSASPASPIWHRSSTQGHRSFPIFGVQFHPESILTKSGMQLLRNFLKMK